MAGTDVQQRVRAIALALPGVTEKLSHGSPAFFATKQFVMLWADGHEDAYRAVAPKQLIAQLDER